MLHQGGAVSFSVDQARQRVRSTGARVTGARVRVLAELMQADEALAHTDVQRRLEQGEQHEVLDRVTLYRVLDWLVEAGLAHRVAGPDRAWRYSAQGGVSAGPARHGHFRCRDCERVVCMDASPALERSLAEMLPEGFRSDAFELTLLGRCAVCSSGAGQTDARTGALLAESRD
jgi:Fur family ferric uptake transcriptional regulator